ncbi:hypothetical protein [Streptomyces violaceus]|uniref:Uncharacterized protein n=1 Tax=Streptomyces violaceus TaxID=1936 RepID=A0ABY9UGV3_STRVL|nr:hypothetical protein [Streptomyces janthinus]WND21522.1 hypothetical protein RI060_31105 [Streptomyces janthinus]GGS99542.1 hypothetical protein GCM10010270_84400 [Streptomyces janthinus]
MMRDGTGAPLRLLPWTTPDGRPCYLSTEGERLAEALTDALRIAASRGARLSGE